MVYGSYQRFWRLAGAGDLGSWMILTPGTYVLNEVFTELGKVTVLLREGEILLEEIKRSVRNCFDERSASELQVNLTGYSHPCHRAITLLVTTEVCLPHQLRCPAGCQVRRHELGRVPVEG